MPYPDYPNWFPQPLEDGYGLDLNTGVIRAEFENGNTRQRRVYDNLPQRFQLTFAMSARTLSSWTLWVNQYGFDWFMLNLASPNSYLGEGTYGLVKPHKVRITSDKIRVNADGFDHFKVTVDVECEKTERYSKSFYNTFDDSVVWYDQNDATYFYATRPPQ